MTTRHWITIAVTFTLLSGGLIYFLMRGGIAPKTMRVLNPTYFDTSEQIGAVVARRFWQEVRETKLLILGSHPTLREYDRIWLGLLSVLKDQGVKVAEVRSVELLRPIAAGEVHPPRTELLSVPADEGLTVVHMVATNADWVELKNILPTYGLLIFTAPLAVNREELERLPLQCLADDPFSMDCLVGNASRPYFRKRRDPKRLSATMERPGLRSFVLFVHEPEP